MHADAGAERVRCQPQHSPLAPPAGHVAAGRVPHGIPDGRSDSGFGSHAEAGIQRGCAFHVRPWTRFVVAARFWRMSSTLGCQSRR